MITRSLPLDTPSPSIVRRLFLFFLMYLALVEPVYSQEVQTFQVHHVELSEVRSLLSELVPEVEYTVDEEAGTITCSGPRGALEQVRQLLQELDHEAGPIEFHISAVLVKASWFPEPKGRLPYRWFSNDFDIWLSPNMLVVMSDSTGQVLAASRAVARPGQMAHMFLGERIELTTSGRRYPEESAKVPVGIGIDVTPHRGRRRHDNRLDVRVTTVYPTEFGNGIKTETATASFSGVTGYQTVVFRGPLIRLGPTPVIDRGDSSYLKLMKDFKSDVVLVIYAFER